MTKHTLGQTRTQQTGNLLDQAVGSDEGIVLACELLDELLVLVQLLQVVGGHGVNTAVLGTIDIVLVTQNADGHVGAGHGGQLDGARETLVTLRVIVLEADLELDSLEEVTLLGLGGCFVKSQMSASMAMAIAMAMVMVMAMAMAVGDGQSDWGRGFDEQYSRSSATC